MKEGIFGPHYIKAHGFDPETPIQVELDIMKEKAVQYLHYLRYNP